MAFRYLHIHLESSLPNPGEAQLFGVWGCLHHMGAPWHRAASGAHGAMWVQVCLLGRDLQGPSWTLQSPIPLLVWGWLRPPTLCVSLSLSSKGVRAEDRDTVFPGQARAGAGLPVSLWSLLGLAIWVEPGS